MEILTITLGLIAVMLYLFYRKRKNGTHVFEKMGLPGPHPQTHWFTGNMLYPQDRYLQIAAWTKQYGKKYGFYMGPRPYLVSSDLDFLNEYMIKQFSNFTDHAAFPIETPDDHKMGKEVFSARGAEWKRLRYIINPTFTSGKLKQVSQLLPVKVDALLEIMEKKSEGNKPVDVLSIYQSFTLDVISDVAFGLNMDIQRNPENPFLKNCKLVFEQMQNYPAILKVAALFPELNDWFFFIFMNVFEKLTPSPDSWIINQFGDIVKHRREQKIERKDLLKLLMDAVGNPDDTMVNDVKNGGKPTVAKTDLTNVRRTLTDEELKQQGYIFLLAGYETSSNALVYLTYLLTINPDKQEILRQEIDDNMPSVADISYDKVMKLEYLDMCVTETLRIYPIASNVVHRTCTSACTVNGVEIPEGTQLLADVWSIHHDPEIYPEPWEFKPERFSAENRATHHPMQFLAFGAGPRHCVGKRFALMEIKFAMVHVMKRFRFERSEKTEVPMPIKECETIQPVNGVYINLVHREQA